MPNGYKLSAAEFGALAGVSRQIITRLANEGKLVKTDRKLDVNDPQNKLYLQEREIKLGRSILSTFQPEEKKEPPKPPPEKPKKPRGRPKGSKNKTTKPPPTKPENPIPPPPEDPDDPDQTEIKELGKKAIIAKYRKEIAQADKAEMDLRKSRAELAELSSIGEACIGYLIALNQELLDQPRSFVDEVIAAIKVGKSKTDITDILRKPAMAAISESMEFVKKEIARYKRDVKSENK